MTCMPRLIALIAACAALSACGNKGPLVLPEAPVVETVEAPVGEVPVERTNEAAATPETAADPSTQALEDTGTGTDDDTPPVGTDPVEPPTPVPGHG